MTNFHFPMMLGARGAPAFFVGARSATAIGHW